MRYIVAREHAVGADEEKREMKCGWRSAVVVAVMSGQVSRSAEAAKRAAGI